MNEKDLYKELSELGSGADMQVQVLHAAVTDVLAKLSLLAPEHTPVFDAAVRSMDTAMQGAKGRGYDVVAVFSGRGPLTAKLREHLKIQRWLANAQETPQDAEALRKVIHKLEDKLKKFDFAPDASQVTVMLLTGMLNHILGCVSDTCFAKPRALTQLRDDNLMAVESGIYSNSGNPGECSLVLHVVLPTQVRAVLLAKHGVKTALWLYHPLEHLWVCASFTVGFEGLQEAFALEFSRVFELAEETSLEAFDYDRELMELSQKSSTVFDREMFLPPIVRLPEGEIVYIKHGFQESMVTCVVGGVSLSFINTGGAFPSRLIGLFTTGNSDSSSRLEPAAVSVEVKRALVNKAQRALSMLVDITNKILSGQMPQHPFANGTFVSSPGKNVLQ